MNCPPTIRGKRSVCPCGSGKKYKRGGSGRGLGGMHWNSKLGTSFAAAHYPKTAYFGDCVTGRVALGYAR